MSVVEYMLCAMATILDFGRWPPEAAERFIVVPQVLPVNCPGLIRAARFPDNADSVLNRGLLRAIQPRENPVAHDLPRQWALARLSDMLALPWRATDSLLLDSLVTGLANLDQKDPLDVD